MEFTTKIHRWDEWVQTDRMRKYNEENLAFKKHMDAAAYVFSGTWELGLLTERTQAKCERKARKRQNQHQTQR